MTTEVESDEQRFARVASIFSAAGFLRTLGIQLDAVGPGRCETSMMVTAAHKQQHGYVHAGAVTTLADHTAGGAARAAVRPGKDVLTIELKINFLAPGRTNKLVAVGRALRAGNRIAVSEVEVFDAGDGERTLIAKLTSTLTVLDERPFVEP